MALAKIDPVGTAIEAAGIPQDSDQAMAIRELVAGGESLDAAIGEFASSASAMVASAQSPSAIKAKSRGKAPIEVGQPTVQGQQTIGDLAAAGNAGRSVGRSSVEPVMRAFEEGVSLGVNSAVEESQQRVSSFLGEYGSALDDAFLSLSGGSD